MTDIKESLRVFALFERLSARERRAAQLEAENAALLDALRPFARIADWFDGFDRPLPDSDILAYGEPGSSITIGDFRRAREVLPTPPQTTEGG